MEQGILEHVPFGGSNWATPIVLQEINCGDMRIKNKTCGDYKICVNHKFIILQLLSTRCEELNIFSKIGLKSVYSRIQIVKKKKLKAVTMINFLIRFNWMELYTS